ncbi:hypothetical protein GPECTOR_26g588 [Gonium pectorale]|uniref:Uncharacterized protein n=1 Tax=Gonium pectorale TaxID=33097 RepID=A0A150GGF6_GONPE|nr:hypothetical protein GPECTOR_26g588 [Gonium pectorale]|eukprot:KXZ48685.1 hypothetical protein GPECTOR_26g588 [Gonium pectorale]
MCNTVPAILKETRPHDAISVQIATWPPNPGATGAAADAAGAGASAQGRRHQERMELVDLLVHKNARRSVAAALGKPLRERTTAYGRASWDRGVEIKVIGANGKYVPYTGPFNRAEAMHTDT